MNSSKETAFDVYSLILDYSTRFDIGVIDDIIYVVIERIGWATDE